MKIYSASREDILKRQEENEASYQEKKARYDEQDKAYDVEEEARANKIKDYIEQELSAYMEPLGLVIYVRPDFKFKTHQSYYSVRIVANNDQAFGYQNNIAMVWNYNIDLDDDGNIKQESGAWSGVDVTTPELLQNLQLSVDCLKVIQSIDWSGLLITIVPPKYSEFVTENDPTQEYRQTKAELDKELRDLDIESLIGTNTLVLVDGDGSNRNYYGNTWMQILRDTGKQYEVKSVTNYMVTDPSYTNADILNHLDQDFPYRVSKDKFFNDLVQPMQTKEL